MAVLTRCMLVCALSTSVCAQQGASATLKSLNAEFDSRISAVKDSWDPPLQRVNIDACFKMYNVLWGKWEEEGKLYGFTGFRKNFQEYMNQHWKSKPVLVSDQQCGFWFADQISVGREYAGDYARADFMAHHVANKQDNHSAYMLYLLWATGRGGTQPEPEEAARWLQAAQKRARLVGPQPPTQAQRPTTTECRNVETLAKQKGRFCLSHEGKWVLVSSNLERTTAGVNVPGCPRPAPISNLPAASAGDEAFADARRRLTASNDFTKCVKKRAEAATSVAQESTLLDVQFEAAAEFNLYMALFTQLWREKGAPQSPANAFIEGTHYIALKATQSSKADVVMFTTLACRRCDYEEMLLKQFSGTHPGVSVAVVSGNFGYSKDRAVSFDAYSKAEIIADLSGGTWRDQIRKALREDGAKPLSSDADVRQLYLRAGYNPQRLDQVMDSTELKLKVMSAESYAARSEVWSMPTYVVRGRYVVPETMHRADGTAVTNPKKLLDVVDHLLKRPP
jgi:hypothetical protein